MCSQWTHGKISLRQCEPVWDAMRNLSELNRLLVEAEGELQRLDARRAELLAQVTGLKQERATALGAQEPAEQQPLPTPVSNHSAQAAKVALFRSLFRGREEVYARRFESLKTGKTGYQPVCRNEWVTGICEKPKSRCDDCGFREFLPVTDDVVRNHLLGTEPQGRPGRDFTIGVYPMLPDETCWFLAADFDKATWQEDAKAFLETCALFKAPVVLERSRSGNGGHCWFFFAEPVSAALARKMGAFLLTQTMERRPEIGLDSYDRFFPSQDTLPKGGPWQSDRFAAPEEAPGERQQPVPGRTCLTIPRPMGVSVFDPPHDAPGSRGIGR